MGSRGPAPKREAQRRRRNDQGKAQQVSADGVNRAPKLTGNHRAVSVRFWERLGESAQAQFFQPSDWAQAELVVLAIDEFVENPSAAMLSSINSLMSGLLVSEADRRRVQIEASTFDGDDPDQEAAIARLADFRDRFTG